MLSISGNAMTPLGVCERVLFLNSSWVMEGSVVPNINGDYYYLAQNDVYTVIFVGPGKIETKVFYNVRPVDK